MLSFKQFKKLIVKQHALFEVGIVSGLSWFYTTRNFTGHFVAVIL